MLAAGERFDRYRIEAHLGAGGMGEVYRAYDEKLQRPVAIKLLRPDTGEATPAGAHARLLREARAAARLRHPNAVAIFDVGERAGTPFITMELVEGRPLRALVGDATVALERRIKWLIQIARALGAAHRAGLVHRDIKPDNVMVDAADDVKLLDFGIAKRSDGAPASTPRGPTAADEASLGTATGRVRGTPYYMSPEQWYGLELDGRSDQFCWGIVAWELIAGVHPRLSGWRHPSDEPVPDLGTIAPSTPAPVASVVMRALARESVARFDTMEAVAALLDETLDPRSLRSPARPSADSGAATVRDPPMWAATTAPLVLGGGSASPDATDTIRDDPPAEAGPTSVVTPPGRSRRSALLAIAAAGAAAAVAWGLLPWSGGDHAPVGPSAPSVTPTTTTTTDAPSERREEPPPGVWSSAPPPAPPPSGASARAASAPTTPASSAAPAGTALPIPAGGLKGFNPDAARAAVDARVRASRTTCQGAEPTEFGGEVDFDPSGRVVGVMLRSTTPDRGELTRRCLQQALKRLEIAPFAGPVQTLNVIVALPGTTPTRPDAGAR